MLIGRQRLLVTVPARRERIAQRAAGIDRRPRRATRDIEHACLLGLIAAGRQHRSLHRLIPQ
jgi:hypothetical protein